MLFLYVCYSKRIRKSRYDSIDSYLTPGTSLCNDVDLEIDEAIKGRLLNEGGFAIFIIYACKL